MNENNIKEQEKVAILVLAYNSENTILETLDSIREQTYHNIYLVISDDASMDNTCNKVEQWIKNYKERFFKVVFRKNTENMGTSKHLKINIEKIPTFIHWIKVIAADDILFPDCIKNNMDYIRKNRCNSAVYSKMKYFYRENEKQIILREDKEEIAYIKKIGKLPAKQQYKALLKRDILCSPTAFINIECYKKSGGCDIRIRNIEDWPIKLNITKNGYKLFIMDTYTVYYRIGESVTKSEKEMFRESFIEQYYQLKKLLCYPYIEKWRILYYYQEFITCFRYWVIIKVCKNKKNRITGFINAILCILVPQKWKKVLYKIKLLQKGVV